MILEALNKRVDELMNQGLTGIEIARTLRAEGVLAHRVQRVLESAGYCVVFDAEAPLTYSVYVKPSVPDNGTPYSGLIATNLHQDHRSWPREVWLP